jgi:hypothetical protein
VRLLWQLGINHVSELLTHDGGCVIPTDDLRTRFGSRTKPKHRRALQVITEILNRPTDQILDPPRPEETVHTKPNRTIHPVFREWAEQTIGKVKPHPTPLYALLTNHKRREPIPDEDKIFLDVGMKKHIRRRDEKA